MAIAKYEVRCLRPNVDPDERVNRVLIDVYHSHFSGGYIVSVTPVLFEDGITIGAFSKNRVVMHLLERTPSPSTMLCRDCIQRTLEDLRKQEGYAWHTLMKLCNRDQLQLVGEVQPVCS